MNVLNRQITCFNVSRPNAGHVQDNKRAHSILSLPKYLRLSIIRPPKEILLLNVCRSKNVIRLIELFTVIIVLAAELTRKTESALVGVTV